LVIYFLLLFIKTFIVLVWDH